MNAELIERVEKFHRTLYTACGLPAFSPTPSMQYAWFNFLAEMTPLEHTAGGALTEADIRRVIAAMRKQNEDGRAKWGLRPQKILQDCDVFFDLVLVSRKQIRQPKPTATTATQSVATITRTVEVPHEEQTARATDFQEAFKQFRK